jgi:galactokinase
MSTAPLESLAAVAAAEFRRQFGRPPRWVVAAPGRVNLIGEHTDYNDGFVLPMALDRHVVIAADRAETAGQARVYSAALGRWATLAVAGPIAPGPRDWSSYVQGVIAGCLAAGLDAGPFDAVIQSDLALGGGLSSSAALEVATATLIEAMTSRRLELLAKALLCQKAEHDFAHVPCGIMDQCSAVMGRDGYLLLLDCRSRAVRLVPLPGDDVAVLVVNSNVRHELGGTEYATRRRQCEEAARSVSVPALRDITPEHLEQQRGRLDEATYRRARHVVTENVRVLETAAALEAGDWPTVGRLMYASHASLRDDFEVSCAELNLLVDLAAAIGPASGMIGSRMTGGGFGGCTVSLVHRAALDAITCRIGGEYEQRTGRPATLFVTRPVDGARVLASLSEG